MPRTPGLNTAISKQAKRLCLAVAGCVVAGTVSANNFSVLGPGLMLWTSGTSRVNFGASQRPLLFSSALDGVDKSGTLGILGLWREYALDGITPGFGVRDRFGALDDVMPRSIDNLSISPSFSIATSLGDGSKDQFLLSVEYNLASESVFHSQPFNRLNLAFEPGAAVYQTLVTPGVGTWLSESTRWDISAVLANQQLGYFGFGGPDPFFDDSAILGESAQGAGVRFGLSSELVPGLDVAVSYQTKIDLDTFETYRGASYDPADFDIPASASFEVSYEASDDLTLYFDTSRVMYGEIGTFNSFLLPDRFLSLLGDGGSPDFRWTDLSIYNIGMSWQATGDVLLSAGWGTGNQPQTSSSLLSQALVPDYADYNATLGISRATDDFGNFGLTARYAPSRYDVGPFAVSTLDRTEVEVHWVFDF